MADLADEQNDNAPGDDGDGRADAQANQPVVLPAAPFFFIKLGGAASPAGTAQRASS